MQQEVQRCYCLVSFEDKLDADTLLTSSPRTYLGCTCCTTCHCQTESQLVGDEHYAGVSVS